MGSSDPYAYRGQLNHPSNAPEGEGFVIPQADEELKVGGGGSDDYKGGRRREE